MGMPYSPWMAALSLVVLACISGCKPSNQYAPPPPKTVTVAHPVQRAITRYLETNGTAASINQVDLVARVQGFLQAQNYQDGRTVTKGTVLFTIEPAPYQAKLQQAQAQEAAIEAQVAQSDAEYDRQASLGKRSFASQSVVDQARATRDANRANLLAAKANTQLAAINLGYTQVEAPFAGVVTAHLVSVGEMVGATGPTKLATIVQLAPIYVTFSMSEQDVERIRASMAARGVTLEQLGPIPVEVGLQTEQGYPHVGKLDYVSPLVDAATGTLTVRAIFQNTGDVLLPGNFVRVRVPTQRDVPALLVPAVALGTDQAGSYVLVVGPDDVVAQKEVTVGTSVGDLRVIETGLKPTDRVVVAGVQRAVPGEKVVPKVETAAAGK
jgi:membrane fusion protein, multidrug efflux system